MVCPVWNRAKPLVDQSRDVQQHGGQAYVYRALAKARIVAALK